MFCSFFLSFVFNGFLKKKYRNELYVFIFFSLFTDNDLFSFIDLYFNVFATDKISKRKRMFTLSYVNSQSRKTARTNDQKKKE